MGLAEDIMNALKEAMKNQDVAAREALRAVKSSFKYAEADKKRPPTEEEMLECVLREAKKRKEAEEAFRSAGRAEQADKEAAERAVIEKFLPEQLSDEEIEAMVKEGIAEVGAEGPKQMGLVMKVVMPRIKGRAGGGRVTDIVKKLLAELA